jgi:hypothetical protein
MDAEGDQGLWVEVIDFFYPINREYSIMVSNIPHDCFEEDLEVRDQFQIPC